MNNKKLRIFLWISWTLFVLSITMLVISIAETYYNLKMVFPNDDLKLMNELVPSILVCALTMIPCIGSEVSFIRGGYKVLKFKPVGFVRICYIVSCSVAFIVTVFQWLVFCGLVDLEKIGSSENLEITVLLLIGWPIFIITFLLGSIPIKRQD